MRVTMQAVGFLSRRAATALAVLGCAVFLMGCSDADRLGPPAGAPNVDLRVQMTSSATAADVAASVNFTITVRNLGPIDATGVVGGDTLPTGLSYTSHTVDIGSYSSSTGVWNIGTLAVGSDAVLTISATVNAGTEGQGLTNRAGVLSTAMNDTVTTNNVAEVTVQVNGEGEPPPVGVFFSSNWSTATGTSDAALSDGGTWNNLLCAQRALTLSVIDGDAVGWTRTPNVLRLQQLGTTCGMLERTNAIPLSTSHWGRFYFRNDEAQSQHNHVITYNPLGDIQLAFWNRAGSASGVRIFMRTYYLAGGVGASYPRNFWSPATLLQNGTWYRYEWHMEYVTATTYRIWPRVYAMNGDLLFDANNFLENDASAASGATLAAFYAAGHTFGFSDVALARNFGLGNEGPASSPNSGQYWYHADVALSTSGWIGQ